MKLKMKDLIATVVIAAIAVPYVGYLLNGEMPLVQDPRGMAAIGLLLGAAAFVVLERGDTHEGFDVAEVGLAAGSLTLGVIALLLAETAAAEVLLAIFMGSILVVWAVKLADHTGVLPMAKHPTGTA
jgi:hypothetical protein